MSGTLTHHPIKLDAPMYGFGTQSRDKLSNLGSPGPGAYNHRDVVGREGSKRSMLGRRPESAPSHR
jgi:hypothetical protein